MIFFIAYGTGGAEALKEVYARIKEKEKVRYYTISDFAHRKTKEISHRVTIEEVKDKIVKERPKVVITERSNGIKEQKEITKICKELHIKNLVIMDIYIKEENNYKELYEELPDYVTAVSEKAYKRLIEIGFNKEQIIRVGNPANIRIKKVENRVINREKPKILFASQGGKGNIEQEELNLMFRHFILHIENHFENYEVDIKLHPMEEENREKWKSEGMKYQNVTVLSVPTEVDFVLECIGDYDLVIGKHSTLQVQAEQMGIPVIYYKEGIEERIKSFKYSLDEDKEQEWYKPEIDKIIGKIQEIRGEI